jgi:Transcriptional regulator
MTEHIVYQDFKLMIEELDMPKGKRKVMIAALELFSEQGFDGTSTVQIAERSGMSEANIFKYFKTKKMLLSAIITPIIENLVPVWGGEFQLKLAQHNSDLRSLIHFVVKDRWSFLSANALSMSILLKEIMTNEEVLLLFKTTIQSRLTLNEPQIIEAFQNTNELDAAQNIKTIYRLFIGQLLVYFIERVRFSMENGEAQESEDLKNIEEVIYKALRKN